MHLLREGPLASADTPPASAPLSSLRDALGRRAALFGPVEADDAPVVPHGAWQVLGDIARRIVEALTPPRAFA